MSSSVPCGCCALVQRWKVHTHGSSQQQQQQIASTASGKNAEAELVGGLDALQVSAKETSDAILSKKELRKLKKDAKNKTCKR